MKVICIGRNYAEHAAELGDEPPTEPLIFGKFENTLIGPGEAIVLPPEATHVDSEAELAVEIGRAGKRIASDDALDHVRGYRVANDVSARNIQYAESQWTRAKGFDTFCPLSTELAPQVRKHLAHLAEQVVAVRALEGVHARAVPARGVVVGGSAADGLDA